MDHRQHVHRLRDTTGLAIRDRLRREFLGESSLVGYPLDAARDRPRTVLAEHLWEAVADCLPYFSGIAHERSASDRVVEAISAASAAHE